MSKGKVVIWGAGGHALYVADIMRQRGEYEIVGFLDSIAPKRKGTAFSCAKVLGGEEVLDDLLASGVRNIVFGFYNSQARIRLSKIVREKGFNLLTAIHPTASIAFDAKIGAGSVIRAQAAVGPQSVLGENVIIGAGAVVCHDCVIADGVYICSGVNLAGGVRIGEGSWIGIGATVIDPANVGRHSKVGGGAVVTRDIPDGVVAYGVPAKVMRKINDKDPI